MLNIENITKSFGDRTVLSDISFQIETGQIVALLGENGAGKSTLLRILSGYFEADSGSIMLDNHNIRNNRIEFLRHIGYVQEVSSMYGDMVVFDFLEFAAKIRLVSHYARLRRMKNIIEQLHIREVLAQKIETLSKGFKKRVELAALLLAEPDVLFLDEPTEGLDPNQKDTLRKIIKKYAANHIIVISTHTLEDVEALADKVVLLHQGKLLFDGSLSDFKKKSKNNLLASFQKATSE